MYCKNFSELSKGDAAIAGGKGASLGEMTNAEIPVPPGFVVLADAFEKFLAETDLNIEIDSILHSVDMKAMHTVEHASETIQKLILEARMPGVISEEIMKDYKDLCAEPARNTSVSDVGGFVAVRSSATAEDSASAAWAGQLDSFLNTTEATLLENVQRCWASLFTPRAIFYRFEQGLHSSKISVAVVVQKMVESEVSGIAFSVHPVTEDYNQLIIEAGFGLGEAIVSGQITPDSYVVEKSPRRIIDKNIANQERGIYRKEKGKMGEEEEMGANEWQSIPPEKRKEQKLSDEQILELSELIIGIENHYGFPCDIEWAFEACPNAEGGRDGNFFIVQSRPITTLAQSTVSVELPAILQPKNYTYIGSYESSLWGSYFWSRWYVEDLGRGTGLTTQSGGWCLFHAGRDVFYRTQATIGIEKELNARLESRDTAYFARLHVMADKEFLAALAFAHSVSVGESDDSLIIDTMILHGRHILFFWSLGWQLSIILDAFLKKEVARQGLVASEIGQYMPQPEIPLMEQQRDAARVKELLQKEIAWYPGEITKMSDAISASSELSARIDEHLREFSWIQNISWNGGRFTLEKLLDQLHHLVPIENKAKEKSPFSDIEEILLHGAYLNQAGSEYLSMFAEAMRPFLSHIAERASISYDELQLLCPDELFIDGELASDIRDKVERRKSDVWCIFTDTDNSAKVLDDPEQIEALEKKFLSKMQAHDVSELVGQVGHKGQARGTARLIISSHDFHKMKEGDVLVAPMTTPDFVLLMQKSSAIVTDMGGMLSHAAIVSRELKKPCIIGTKIATQVLHDGDLVEVDADHGIVRILERARE